MDYTAIIVGGLAMIGTILGSWMGVRESNRLVNFRLDALEQKVMKHNQLVERTAMIERDVKAAFHIIDEMKENLL